MTSGGEGGGEESRKRLNVLLVTNLYPTPVEPTRGIFIHQLAKRLRALCDVTVVCPLPWFPALPLPRVAARWRAFSGVPAEYTIDGVEVYSPKYPLLPRVSESIHASLMRSTLSGAIARLHAKHRFDVINAQWLYPDGVAATRIGERLGIPVVLSALGSDVNVFVTEPRKWKQISRSLRSSAAITTVSRDLKQRLVAESVPESRITAVLNGADHDLFRPMPKEECRARLGIDPRLKAIVFVGRLVPIKGIGHLVDAAARLAQRRQDFAVHLVGDGHLRAACEADIRARGLGERVKLVGGRSHAEIPVWMGACDAFCLPSLAEGCPNVVLEALFSGRPVVASRTGGIPEMVGPQNGVLVEPGDAAALADGLDRALSRSWDAAAVRDSVMHLTWEAAAQGYHEVFVSVSHPRAA